MAPSPESFLAVVPALNEGATVGTVVREILKEYPEATVLVIDDGSTDDTGAVAKAAGALVARHPANLGVGAAMRTGFQYAEAAGFDLVVQVDADGQHDPAQIRGLLAGLDQADVVVGSRFSGGDYQMSFARRTAIRFLSYAVSRLCHSRITDATSGFRATGPRALPVFARFYPTEYLGDTVESLTLAARLGLQIDEVPAAMRTRQGGRRSQSFLSGVLHLARSVSVVLQSGVHRLPDGAQNLVRRT